MVVVLTGQTKSRHHRLHNTRGVLSTKFAFVKQFDPRRSTARGIPTAPTPVCSFIPRMLRRMPQTPSILLSIAGHFDTDLIHYRHILIETGGSSVTRIPMPRPHSTCRVNFLEHRINSIGWQLIISSTRHGTCLRVHCVYVSDNHTSKKTLAMYETGAIITILHTTFTNA